MTITARFASTCPRCGKRITIGDQVEWQRGQKATHVSCSAEPRPQLDENDPEFGREDPRSPHKCPAVGFRLVQHDGPCVRRERRMSSGQIRYSPPNTHVVTPHSWAQQSSGGGYVCNVCWVIFDSAEDKATRGVCPGVAGRPQLRPAPFDQATQRDQDDDSYDAWLTRDVLADDQDEPAMEPARPQAPQHRISRWSRPGDDELEHAGYAF